jgi:two-component system, OmpR family, sensor kinase
VAASVIGLVGDYLFDDRRTQDQAAVEKLAVVVSPLFLNADTEALQSLLELQSGEMGGRLMVLDPSGKVQADSFSELNGKRLEIPEVASILLGEKTVDYGVHGFDPDRSLSIFSYFGSLEGHENDWVAYCSATIFSDGQTVGVLVYSSSVGGMMASLVALQKNMIVYFLIAAFVAAIIALILSRLITKPIDRLTRGIQRMGRGDLSVRVPVKGGGELKKLAETFNTMSEKLERLDKSRNQFVSNASHELKTPLSTMKILLENIIYQPDMKAEIRTEFLTDVNSEIDRLNLIISDLLTLVSMDTNAMRLRLETFKIADLVTEVVQRLSVVARQKQQEIKLNLSDGCEMHADRAKLTQVVYNILDNAIKYTQPGGVIRMRLVRSGRNAVLTIADNGPGIPKEDQAHIFDRFYRVDKARSRDTGGTGLGLSIVHQFVLMHGGNVTVDSTEGSGTTFTVELPMGGHLAGLGEES